MDHIADISEALLELGLSSSVTDEERAIVDTALLRAEAAVRRYLGYDPVYGSHTEFYPNADYQAGQREGVWEVSGDQAVMRELTSAQVDELQLRHIPVRSITHLYVDYDGRCGTKAGAFAAATEKTVGVDFWSNYDGVDSVGVSVCRDGILRSSGMWPVTTGSVKVVYVAGYKAAELHGQDSVLSALPILEAVVGETCRRVRSIMALKKRTGAGFVPGIITSESLGDYSYSVDSGSANQQVMGGDLCRASIERLMEFRNFGGAL